MAGVARGAPIFEPNNSPGAATILPSGQLVVADSLSANIGRPDTLLAHYNAAYSTQYAVDDNSSPLGNGFASQLVGVPLDANGSAYFRVTGAGDPNFNGAHTQSGQYYVRFDLYDSGGNFFKTLPLEYDSVIPGFIDNIWIDPPLVFEPQRVGGTVTVSVENIVGPGTGDSLDFFLFSGLQPNQAFTATLSAEFAARLGVFGSGNTLLLSDETATPTLAGTADAQGRVLLGVTGKGDGAFAGVHAQAGDYTLTVTPYVVPEPRGLALWLVGMALGGWLFRRR